ncbi:DNA-binding response regulator [Caulobacter segnis]|uniref:Two component transcriptional regulator, LuxR family n=2 Tax=Caulobacter segnis TaxID=88688 RepID=D5VJN3_CAUST|nr:response regulator transcription factor [Caulobacter segnis]ADG10562.1 two component transcriptional regulator, LuxR family [Caulobacter segnis ATCC 21756]AVQ02279.1 DNA-binding response regulator [Caulobacter segnis]
MNDVMSVLIVDDHPLLREGVAAVLEAEPDIQVVGEAADGQDAIAQFKRLRPDVVLMDLQMPGVDGVEAIREIRAQAPDARIIVLTTYAGDVRALSALRAGASGYLLKSSLRRELIDTIRAVLGGQRYLHPEVAHDIAVNAIAEPLSEREIDVLKRVANGAANKEIARALSLSEDTVKGHMRSIFSKLDVTDRTQAVTVAHRRGIIAL